MKQQVLAHKRSVFIFTALLFIHVIHGVTHAQELKFVERDTATREVAENAAVGTRVGDPLRFASGNCLRFRLRGPDAGSFDLARVSRGVQLKTKITFDYETKSSYEVQVVATGAGNSDTITVTINVIDVNEAPMFTEAMDGADHLYRSIPENTPAGSNIGNPISAIDPDGSEVTLTYSLGGANADMFQIDGEMGQLRTKAPLDYEAFQSEPRAYFISISVSDGAMSDEIQVRVDVEPVNEFAPVFVEGETATREIHEKEAVGSNVGEPVSATDMDMGETLEYSLKDTDPDVFEINSTTGQLNTKAALDHATKPAYTMKVIVSDGSRVDSITVTVNVLTDEKIVSAPSAPTANWNITGSPLDPAVIKTLERETLQTRLQRLYAENDGSLLDQRAITMFENVLASMHPDKTALLVNYPNPFNPETWIPYHLAKAANVQIDIYDAYGTVVKHLGLGHQSAGYYTRRNHAAYWDGKNDFGERVSSGIYFYQLQADTVSPLRKMVILK